MRRWISFIHHLTPPPDPTLMFKALFLGYLFGLRSARQLAREIEVNVAYRWFLRLWLRDKVFAASTLPQIPASSTSMAPKSVPAPGKEGARVSGLSGSFSLGASLRPGMGMSRPQWGK